MIIINRITSTLDRPYTIGCVVRDTKVLEGTGIPSHGWRGSQSKESREEEDVGRSHVFDLCYRVMRARKQGEKRSNL